MLKIIMVMPTKKMINKKRFHQYVSGCSINLTGYKSATPPKLNSSTIAWSILFLLLVTSSFSFAQNLVTIPVETEKNVMVLQTDNEGRLGIIYFGNKLANTTEYAGIPSQYNLKSDNAPTYNSC
jgi:hypothetical protein